MKNGSKDIEGGRDGKRKDRSRDRALQELRLLRKVLP